MTESQDRVDARRAIQEKAIARRREREQKDERIAKLAVAVNVALKTGRRALEEAEAEAWEALTQMITTESIRVTEAIEWVGDSMLTPREVARCVACHGPSRALATSPAASGSSPCGRWTA